MSCCGGCGFYRRRQVFLTQQQVDQLTQGPPPGGNTTVLGAGRLTYSSTTTGRSLVAHPMMYQGNAGPQGYFQGPPSYTEVRACMDKMWNLVILLPGNFAFRGTFLKF